MTHRVGRTARRKLRDSNTHGCYPFTAFKAANRSFGSFRGGCPCPLGHGSSEEGPGGFEPPISRMVIGCTDSPQVPSVGVAPTTSRSSGGRSTG